MPQQPELIEFVSLTSTAVLLQENKKPALTVMNASYLLTNAYNSSGHKLNLDISKSVMGELTAAQTELREKFGANPNLEADDVNAAMAKYVTSEKVQMLKGLFPKGGAVPDTEAKKILIKQYIKGYSTEGKNISDKELDGLLAGQSDVNIKQMFDGQVAAPLFGKSGFYYGSLRMVEQHKGNGMCGSGCYIAPAIQDAASRKPTEVMKMVESSGVSKDSSIAK